MPHPNAPLSYDPLKAVLKHMDPNKRALLVTKCPSLRTPDSNVPQKIESISVGPARITINNTTYQLGVIRKYPQGAVLPERHLEINNGGGEHHDVDRYGFNITTPEVTPGDFPITVIRPIPEEQVRNKCQAIIFTLKQILNGRKQKKKSMEAIAQMRRNRDVKERSRRIAILKKMDEAIAEVEADILPYQLRIDNNEGDIPFTLYLQLTISTNGPDGRRIQSIERVEYNQNLGQATKYLIGRLLKKPMNYVNELRISPFGNKDCFWLPAEMNLTARQFIIERVHELVERTVGEFFRRINHRPFQLIGHGSYHDNLYNGTWYRTEALFVKQMNPSLRIHTIPHSRIHFDFFAYYDRFIGLIDYWVIHGAPIGTYHTAYINPREAFVWCDKMTEREGHTVVMTPTRGWQCLFDCVILPLPNNTQLEFFITPIENHPYPLQLNLEVQPRKN